MTKSETLRENALPQGSVAAAVQGSGTYLSLLHSLGCVWSWAFCYNTALFDGVCNDLSACSLNIHVLNVELFVPSSTALDGQVSKANKPLVSVARSQREI